MVAVIIAVRLGSPGSIYDRPEAEWRRRRSVTVAVSVRRASPEKARLSMERFAASSWPAPQASVTTTGMKPRSAPWRTVG
jgi:hypothetical protein